MNYRIGFILTLIFVCFAVFIYLFCKCLKPEEKLDPMSLYILEDAIKHNIRDIKLIKDNIKDMEGDIQRNAAHIKILRGELRDFSEHVTSFLNSLDVQIAYLKNYKAECVCELSIVCK